MLATNIANENIEFVFKDEQFFCVRISLSIYKLISVLKSAYKFTDKCYIHIEPIDKEELIIRIKAKSSTELSEELAHDFCNELLEQELRLIISQETESVRNLIIAHAFSKTALIEADLETMDYVEDPLQIGIPDREHNGIKDI